MKDIDHALVELNNAAIAARAVLNASGGQYLAAKKAYKVVKDLDGPINTATQLIWAAVKVGDIVKVLSTEGIVVGPGEVKRIDEHMITLDSKRTFNSKFVQLIAHEVPSTEC